MKKFVLDYINKIEGWKISTKEYHWLANNYNIHEQFDYLLSLLISYQDNISEIEQSISGDFPTNGLKGINSNVGNIKDFIGLIISETIIFLKKVRDNGDDYIGMCSIIESFIADVQRFKYRINIALKDGLTNSLRDK